MNEIQQLQMILLKKRILRVYSQSVHFQSLRSIKSIENVWRFGKFLKHLTTSIENVIKHFF